jgi:two-component system, NtrC family, nitrogen regulation response regulator NtrX
MTAETILIVDDEEPVRRTFQEWLAGSGLPCELLVAADAETALRHANRGPIDLAILDWNLGAGNHGLQLLEDLSVFQPDIVAILVTGYAHQATPLDALRMGVRDYLDKNQDLNRDTFLAAVRKQLDRIRPAKQHRELHRQLAAFRESVEKVLPLVQSSAALNDPVPLPTAVASLCRFLRQVTGAADAVLLVRHVPEDGAAESYQVYDADGSPVAAKLVPFARSLAATAASMAEPCVMNTLADRVAGTVELQPFERGRTSVLAVPLAVGPGAHVVLELFDKPGGFTADDRRLAAAAADIGAELLRQALADRQVRTTLFDAVAAALDATQFVAGSGAAPKPDEPPPAAVLETLRENLATARAPAVEADAALRLAEAVRVLAVRHGKPAVEHCVRVVESLREMLSQNDQ